MNIPFNKPFLSGSETEYITDAVISGKISGDGKYTKKVHQFFESQMGFQKCLLTTSCTDALEMAAILTNIQEGDQVIAPSYTFVSTVNAFVLRGAKIVFADSKSENPNIDESQIESLITPKTKVIIVVHYAGIACDMDVIMDIAAKHDIVVVEDAAQAIDSYYKGKRLGSIGSLSAFSFHETKNIISGEGGMLCINDEKYNERAEIIREKGTNRSQFFRGEVDKYGWIDIGSSFLPSDIIAAFLYAQLEKMNIIQTQRKRIWDKYMEDLSPLKKYQIQLPEIPSYATNNAHMFYLVCTSLAQRTKLIEYLKGVGIYAVFHYQSLHKSAYYVHQHDGHELLQSDRYTDCLVRLPFYYELTDDQQSHIIAHVIKYFEQSES
ncbi:MAG TPA: dTDP-4-amino-4,6-dideoxygalactose transaminase [Saprospiraceae bacterium]|nr:dTDP-4-amino-4,6-dideoxygalactose transaminase [Saprospiraceae bacterium]